MIRCHLKSVFGYLFGMAYLPAEPTWPSQKEIMPTTGAKHLRRFHAAATNTLAGARSVHPVRLRHHPAHVRDHRNATDGNDMFIVIECYKPVLPPWTLRTGQRFLRLRNVNSFRQKLEQFEEGGGCTSHHLIPSERKAAKGRETSQ
jgi:hypothetical protein